MIAGPFAAARVCAALSTVCVALASVVYPLTGYGWHAVAGALCVAAVLAWVSHDLARHVRLAKRARRIVRRVEQPRNVRVLPLPDAGRNDWSRKVKPEDDWSEDDVLADVVALPQASA